MVYYNKKNHTNTAIIHKIVKLLDVIENCVSCVINVNNSLDCISSNFIENKISTVISNLQSSFFANNNFHYS